MGIVPISYKFCNMSEISLEPYFHTNRWSITGFLNQANRTSESHFTACQNSLSEHSFEGVPASLYNLTKSVPDPFFTTLVGRKCSQTIKCALNLHYQGVKTA